MELLEQQSATRVPELVPIRYGRMLVSPFTFYRGAARIMASDLAAAPRSGLMAQACGDAHLSNFGAFASRERRLVFDINDFDETLPGPWEWDVKRLAASMLIGARDNGFSTADQERIVLETAAQYRASMARYAAMKNLEVWYAHTEITELAERVSDEIGRTGRRNLKRSIARARAARQPPRVLEAHPRGRRHAPLRHRTSRSSCRWRSSRRRPARTSPGG